MKTRHLRVTLLPACIALLAFAVPAVQADPPNTAVLDGRPLEYDAGDWRGSFTNAPTWGADNVVSNLYVTWDATHLYIALHGYSRPPENNKLAVLIDVDPGAGTGATTTTNWINTGSGPIDYNDAGWQAAGVTAFGLDYMVASEGAFNNLLRVLYDGVGVPALPTTLEVLFDVENAAGATGGAVDMATLENGGTGCNLLAMEARIPWTVLYDPNVTNGLGAPRFGEPGSGGVPTGATLRVVAILHNNSPNDPFNNPDAIPPQVGANSAYTNGLLTTDDYIDVVVDADNDGIPDDVALGDVNGPWLSGASGAQGKQVALALFNEPVLAATATNPANWSVAGGTPSSVTLLSDRIAKLNLTNALPGNASALLVQAAGVQDLDGNARTLPAEVCFFTGSGGIDQDVTVTFVLETNSGLGINPGATQFFVNGGTLPLEFGFPPATSMPMSVLSGSLYSATVNFVAGSPSNLNYKYSGRLSTTGTNNYEAIRLANYLDAARPLTLPNDGSSLVVTDYLGAAAGPLRSGGTGYTDLYNDPNRGDAGVRARHTILFQLDLSLRVPPSNARIVVAGSDPLRGFNSDGTFTDFPSSPVVSWASGGLELFDNGNNGDLVAGDGIYSRLWSFTDDGLDSILVPDFPNSLVDPGFAAGPYFGSWQNRRSPRSMTYKFFIKDLDDPDENVFFQSPAQDISLYLGSNPSNAIVLPPHVWDDDGIPVVSEAFPAEILSITRTGANMRVVFSNIPQATDNELEFATDPTKPWRGYGQVPQGSVLYTALVSNAGTTSEMIRVRTPGHPGAFTWWEPNPLPATGGTLRIWYTQNRKNLAGVRQVYWFGANPGPGAYVTQPMTYVGAGNWYIDITVASNANRDVRFLFIDTTPDFIPGVTKEDKNMHPDGSNKGPLFGDFNCMIGGRATWSPDPVQPGQPLTITYDATGGPLQGAAAVHIWLDYDGWEELQPWNGALFETPMTSIGANLWQITVTVPADTKATANFVFKTPPLGGAGATFDGNPDSETRSRDWTAFVRP